MIRAALGVLGVLGVLGAADARADIWKDAAAGQAGADADEFYTRALERGDDAAGQALQRGTDARVIIADVRKAIAAYEVAANARPRSGEPYARISATLYSFYFEYCPPPAVISERTASPLCGRVTPDVTTLLLAAWHDFEIRSPLDPRLRAVRFDRAIVNTRVGLPTNIQDAAQDYEAILRFGDADDKATVASNLAETYMMEGRLDEAIEMYRLSIDYNFETTTAFGLAVALDRNEETTKARELLHVLGANGLKRFTDSIESGHTFFVPEGETFYYLALADEEAGNLPRALREWQFFIASGAFPRYQIRAQTHIRDLSQPTQSPVQRAGAR